MMAWKGLLVEDQRVVINEDKEVDEGLLTKGLPQCVMKTRFYLNAVS